MESILAESSGDIMDSIAIPLGFHWIPYGIQAYPPWIPWTSPYGSHGIVHMDFMEQVHVESMEQIQMELMTITFTLSLLF